jgi:hypothetical protein
MSERGQTPPTPVDAGITPDEHQPYEPAEEPFELSAEEPFELGVMGAADDDAPEVAARHPRSRVRRIVLSSLLAVGVAGAAALGYAAWQITSQKDATLTLPARIGSLSLDDSEDGKSTADYLQTALAAEVKLDKTVGAVYTDDADKSVLLLGGTGLIWTPESDLDTAFGLIADAQSAVTGLHEVDAGPLKGTMKCGVTKSDDTDLTVCGWADHGSLALAMFPDRSEADSAKLLRQIRDTTEKRE